MARLEAMESLISTNLLYSVAMLGVFALVFGGIALWRRGDNRKQAVLMVIAALVLLGNVLILTA